MAFEATRILHRLGCDVRILNPSSLPTRDSVDASHASVQELRSLSLWSDGHIWCLPEQHSNLTAIFKNQIDWILLSTGSVRPHFQLFGDRYNRKEKVEKEAKKIAAAKNIVDKI